MSNLPNSDHPLALDLFKLHDHLKDDKPKKWIVAKGPSLRHQLDSTILQLAKKGYSKTQLVKYFIRKLSISITTSERLIYLKKEWFPLIFIKELILMTEGDSNLADIQPKIKYLKASQPPLKVILAPQQLTANLCKIAGAHAADGTVHGYYFSIVDGYESNLRSFQNWLEQSFGLKTRIIKVSDREWRISFHSKIFTRYLTRILGFPDGSKQYTVREPFLIRKSNLHLRKAFTLGALTFESGIGIRHQVELCVASKAFRDDLSRTLELSDVRHVSMKSSSRKYWRLWSGKLSPEQALTWMDFFEPNTEKYNKLKSLIDGCSSSAKNYEEAKAILLKTYPVNSASKINVVKVLEVIKKKRRACSYDIVSELTAKNSEFSGGKWAHSINPYLDILMRSNIITFELHKFGKKKSFGSIIRKVYIFNSDIEKWRLPS